MHDDPRNQSSPGARPRRYVVEYEGAQRDDAEFQAELDERAHRLNGYVPTHRAWVHREWTRNTLLRHLLGKSEGAVLRTLFSRRKVLAVTYTREDETEDA